MMEAIIAQQTPEEAPPALYDNTLLLDYWKRMTEIVESHNDPGTFLAVIGYEWTSTTGGNNLHRNIIYRDGKAVADQVRPLNAADTDIPNELWDWSPLPASQIIPTTGCPP